jgi:hypothetical protein
MLRKLLAAAASGLAIASFLTGCFPIHQQAYYVSPFNGNSEGYHTQPLHTDSVHTAVFTRANFFHGAANDNSTDHFSGANASIYLAQHQGILQWYYGLDASLGSYRLGTWDSGYSGTFFVSRTLPPGHAQMLDAYSGPKTFGGVGFSGGINGVIPMGQGEWRFLGIETALHQEFGDYLHLRRKIPDTLVTYIVRQPFFGTLGLTSEWVIRTYHGDFGFRIAGGWTLGSAYNNLNIYDNLDGQHLSYGYSSFSAHYTYDRWTFWYQGESSKKGSSSQVGFIWRLGNPRAPAKKHLEHRQPPPHPPHPGLPSWMPHHPGGD